MEKDRWNLAKFKVLRSLFMLKEANSIQIAQRTEKEVYETTQVLKRLVRQRHIRPIVPKEYNHGCSYRYRLTKRGEEYLLKKLQPRFLKNEDLNLRHIPVTVPYNKSTLKWRQKEFPNAPSNDLMLSPSRIVSQNPIIIPENPIEKPVENEKTVEKAKQVEHQILRGSWIAGSGNGNHEIRWKCDQEFKDRVLSGEQKTILCRAPFRVDDFFKIDGRTFIITKSTFIEKLRVYEYAFVSA